MAGKLYQARNYLSTAIHYTGALAVGAGAISLGTPAMVIAGAAVATGLAYWGLKGNKDFFENHMNPHPDAHRHSPNLRAIVKNLYKVSGLNPGKHLIYDFKVNAQAKYRKKGIIGTILQKAMEKMSETPNAAALNLRKPVIMISEPLLHLLDDEEEKAVLAHEFAHAAARHQHYRTPHKLISAAARTANTFAVYGAALATGFLNFALGFTAMIGTALGFMALHPKRGELFKDDEKLNLQQIREKKKVTKIAGLFGSAVGISFFTYLNPAYLPILASAKGMAVSSKILEASLSRSMEYQADKGAVTFGASPLALIRALRKIDALMQRSKQNVWGDSPVPQPGALTKIWKNLNATHPTTERRVGRLSAIAHRQGFSAEQIDQAAKGPVDISHAKDIPYNIIREIAAR